MRFDAGAGELNLEPSTAGVTEELAALAGQVHAKAGNLTAVERPKEGETAEIKDAYAYNGEGLRTSQTISGTTTYMAWDLADGLPLLFSDGTNSYIYGPGGLPIEQISSGGTTFYLHHDQQGSTRLLTGSTGAKRSVDDIRRLWQHHRHYGHGHDPTRLRRPVHKHRHRPNLHAQYVIEVFTSCGIPPF